MAVAAHLPQSHRSFHHIVSGCGFTSHAYADDTQLYSLSVYQQPRARKQLNASPAALNAFAIGWPVIAWSSTKTRRRSFGLAHGISWINGGGRGACDLVGTVQGAAFGGAKIWNSEIWPLLANWRLRYRTDSAGIYITLSHTRQLIVPFVTVHTNAIVVTIRISVADLIGGAATQTFAPGGKHPRAARAPARQRCIAGAAPGTPFTMDSSSLGARCTLS